METKFAEIPDELWEQIEPLLPPQTKGAKRGRPPIPNRTILSGIVYRLRTGSQWKALPAQFGSGSTCHARFQAWTEAGIFRRLFEKLVRFYDDVCGVDWEWASLDSAIVKAPKGGDATGPNPTDRGKAGVKRHILTDGRGVPLAAEITAANVHDKRAAVPTIDAQLCILDEPQPVQRLAHLLVRDTDLVDEVGATLGTARFLVVRSTAGRRPHQLPQDVFRRRALRERLAQPNHSSREPTQPDRDVLALHARHATRRV